MPTPTHLPPTGRAEAIAWMNERYFVAPENGKPIVFTEDIDPVFQRPILYRLSFEDIRNQYQNRIVPIMTPTGVKDFPLGQLWLRSPDRREYTAVVFDPSEQTPEHVYNRWRGFQLGLETLVGDEDLSWSLLKDHLRDVICSGDPDLFAYHMGWLATLVQHPERQAQTALVWRGPQGAGKSTPAREIGKIFGPHFLMLNQPGQVTGRFNSHLEETVLLLLDEAFGTDDKRAQAVLKTLITEPDFPVEQKFATVRHAKNRLHIIISSNEDWVVPVGLDDRRFCVTEVSDERQGDRAYFEEMVKQMEHGGRLAMYSELMGYDLSTFDVVQDRPRTDALVEQKLYSMSTEQAWWYDKLERGRVLPGHDGWKTEVSRAALVEDFAEAVGGRHSDPSRLAIKLGLFLKKVLPGVYPRDYRPATAGKQERLWEIPSLRDCRGFFSHKVLRQTISWPSGNQYPESSQS